MEFPLTMATVKSHATEQTCYVVINGNVYDLTTFIARHKGGAAKILALCGTDGTVAFQKQHGSYQKAIDTLASFQIGTLE